MTLMRFVAVVALALWIGGLSVLGAIAAPTTFAVLEAQLPETGRALAGVVFGAMLTRAQYATWICGVLLLVSLGVRAALGPRPRLFGVRTWIVAGMLAASVATTLVISPRIEAIRSNVPGAVAALSDDDPRKTTFGRLHALSSILMLATIVAGVGLLWSEVRDHG